MGWRQRAHERRAARALERQLDYMRGVAASWQGREAEKAERLERYSARIRGLLDAQRPIRASDRLLEVGSGADGALFFFGLKDAVGVDPLADEYRKLFPWHSRARTVSAGGERLPFEDATFDIVISDNVIDHAENPCKIVAEIARVMKPGGILYLTVHVHHPIYHAASVLHGAWTAAGIPIEITPFADHTVHFTPASARRLFASQPLRLVHERDDIEESRRAAAKTPPRHLGDRLKRLFYKNATYEVIALRQG